MQTRDPAFLQPGSRICGAPLRHSPSKTGVNALMAPRPGHETA